MKLGHGHRRSVLILWAWTALLSAFVLYPVLTDENPTYLPFGIGALASCCTPSSTRGRRRNGAHLTPSCLPHAIERTCGTTVQTAFAD